MFSIRVIFFLIILANVSHSQFWIKISDYDGYYLTIDEEGVIFLGGYYDLPGWDSGIYVSEDDGYTFHEIGRFGNEEFVSCMTKSRVNNTVYLGTGRNGIFKITDNGLNLQYIGLRGQCINGILSANNGNLYAATDDYIYHSINEGIDWKADSISLNGFYNILTWSLFEDSQGYLYAGTECGLYRSTKGNSWNFMASFNCGDILCFAEKDNKIYMGGADRFYGIHRSDDRGISWKKVFNEAWTTNAILAAPDGNIYIAARGGIYRTNSNDTLWEPINSGLQFDTSLTLIGTNIQYSPNGYLYTTAGGLYRSKEKIFQVPVPEPDIPLNFSLLQNYPNPFNASTVIKYLIPQQTNLTITIYNPVSQEIIKLVDEEKPAGEYETQWNASSYPSGVYFVRMQAGSFSETRKLILIK